MRRHLGPAVVMLAIGLVLGSFVIVSADPSRDEQADVGRFDVGLIGDSPYTAEEEPQFRRMIEEMNRKKLDFTLHVGDIKAGSAPCTDDVLFKNLAYFNSFNHPLIYTPGDNEWTDCRGDPISRLARIREIFFSTDESLGQRRLTLTRQSDDYPENARFAHGDVTVVSLHIVGSNNNRSGNEAEYRARNAADLQWLEEGFRAARAAGSKALVIFMQANPGFDLPAEGRTGYNDFLRALEKETLAFTKPVVLIHGDTHYFRVDKPMWASASRRRVKNFTRAETFGSPDIHWVRASVDPDTSQVVSFRQEIVADNP